MMILGRGFLLVATVLAPLSVRAAGDVTAASMGEPTAVERAAGLADASAVTGSTKDDTKPDLMKFLAIEVTSEGGGTIPRKQIPGAASAIAAELFAFGAGGGDAAQAPDGLPLRGLTQDSFLWKLGLRDGDLLRSINGTSVAEGVPPGFMNGFANADNLTLSVRRGEQDLTIELAGRADER